jgi:hypothetical protein
MKLNKINWRTPGFLDRVFLIAIASPTRRIQKKSCVCQPRSFRSTTQAPPAAISFRQNFSR